MKKKNVIEIFLESVKRFPNSPMRGFREENNKEFKILTYKDIYELVGNLALSLIDIGIKFGDKVALISNNRLEWIISDLAILSIGSADVPRGSDSTDEEILYIINHSESIAAIVENIEQVEKIEKHKRKLRKLKHIIIIDGDENYIKQKNRKTRGKKYYLFYKLIEKGKTLRKQDKLVQEYKERQKNIERDTLATIIYTSGTTGEPKGVMLLHKNFIHNIETVQPLLEVYNTDIFLSLLPSWHVFQRIVEYIAIKAGGVEYYTNPRQFAEDLIKVKPTYIPVVPRILENIYNKLINTIKQEPIIKQKLFYALVSAAVNYMRNKKILTNEDTLYSPITKQEAIKRKIKAIIMVLLLYPVNKFAQSKFQPIRDKLGGRLRYVISGGGALPLHIDEFFNAIGITILEGYGLTETSPVIAVRYPKRVVLDTVGPPLEGITIKIKDKEGNDITEYPGTIGVLWVKGENVMKGYYKAPEKTKEVFDEEGFFNTGDLVKLTIRGEISITGREKDTIVLLGGENIEPEPIEQKLRQSPYIEQCMVVGQDQKYLGALIVPDKEHLTEFLKENDITLTSWEEVLKHPKVLELYKSEIRRLISYDEGFKSFERIAVFRLLKEEFKINEELTQTLKLKRHYISKKYENLIKEMFK